MRVFIAIANSTDLEDGLDVSESADFLMLHAAERWINRRADRYLGASIYEVERQPCSAHDDVRCDRLGCVSRGEPHEIEMLQRIYTWEAADRFDLAEIVDLTGERC